jgi:hypothetical protein
MLFHYEFYLKSPQKEPLNTVVRSRSEAGIKPAPLEAEIVSADQVKVGEKGGVPCQFIPYIESNVYDRASGFDAEIPYGVTGPYVRDDREVLDFHIHDALQFRH